MMNPNREMVFVTFIVAIIVILLLLGFIIGFLFLHQRRQQHFTLKVAEIKANYDKELLKAQLEIQEQTFQYISQEIHDNIGQFISLAKLHLNTLNFSNIDAVRKQVINSTELLTRALEDLRDLSKSLSSEIIRNGGLTRAVDFQIMQLRKLESPRVVYEIQGDYQYLDEQKEIFVLRILQEAINNIIRHSGADTMEVILAYRDTDMTLLIRDNGKGFNPAYIQSANPSGISNIRKRAKIIGATCAIESREKEGTLITITIPY